MREISKSQQHRQGRGLERDMTHHSIVQHNDRYYLLYEITADNNTTRFYSEVSLTFKTSPPDIGNYIFLDIW